MRMTGAMAADFITVLHPVLEKHGLADSVRIACCDATGWSTQRNMSLDILADAKAAPLVGVFTSHLYTSKIDGPLPSEGQRAWMSEYADLGDPWSIAWFSANASAHNDTKATAGDGLTWARSLHTGLTTGNLSAFLWWVATQDAATNGNNNEKLVLVDDATGNYTVAKRLWAFAQFSRAARPGAVRVGVDVAAAGGNTTSPLRTVAFHNTDGAVSVVLINDSADAVMVRVASGVRKAASVEAWMTDSSYDMADMEVAINRRGDVTQLLVPAHGIVSVIVRREGGAGAVCQEKGEICFEKEKRRGDNSAQ